jgi:hypothetical protein
MSGAARRRWKRMAVHLSALLEMTQLMRQASGNTGRNWLLDADDFNEST